MRRALGAALSLVLALVLSAAPRAQAQPDGPPVTATQVEATEALTRTHVRTFLRLRLATEQLRRQYEANAAAYDDVVRAYFTERDRLLREEGWTPDAFERLEARITNAQNAIEQQADKQQAGTAQGEGVPAFQADSVVREVDTALQDMLKEIENTPHLSAEQRAQMRQQILAQQQQLQARRPQLDSLAQQQVQYTQAMQAMIDATRPDWPAVRPYLDALAHLIDYVAGNRPDPPNLDRLPSGSP